MAKCAVVFLLSRPPPVHPRPALTRSSSSADELVALLDAGKSAAWSSIAPMPSPGQLLDRHQGRVDLRHLVRRHLRRDRAPDPGSRIRSSPARAWTIGRRWRGEDSPVRISTGPSLIPALATRAITLVIAGAADGPNWPESRRWVLSVCSFVGGWCGFRVAGATEGPKIGRFSGFWRGSRGPGRLYYIASGAVRPVGRGRGGGRLFVPGVGRHAGDRGRGLDGIEARIGAMATDPIRRALAPFIRPSRCRASTRPAPGGSASDQAGFSSRSRSRFELAIRTFCRATRRHRGADRRDGQAGAERRIGELMAGQREAGRMNEGGRPELTGSQSDPTITSVIAGAADGPNLRS